jgi:hypothetical protein
MKWYTILSLMFTLISGIWAWKSAMKERPKSAERWAGYIVLLMCICWGFWLIWVTYFK